MSKTNFEKQQKTFNNFISNFTTKGFRELTAEELFTVNGGKKRSSSSSSSSSGNSGTKNTSSSAASAAATAATSGASAGKNIGSTNSNNKSNSGKPNNSTSSHSSTSSNSSVSPSDKNSSNSQKSYTVQSGDTLSQITANYNKEHGTNYTYQQIAEKNGISNPDVIHPGQQISFGEDMQPDNMQKQCNRTPQSNSNDNHKINNNEKSLENNPQNDYIDQLKYNNSAEIMNNNQQKSERIIFSDKTENIQNYKKILSIVNTVSTFAVEMQSLRKGKLLESISKFTSTLGIVSDFVENTLEPSFEKGMDCATDVASVICPYYGLTMSAFNEMRRATLNAFNMHNQNESKISAYVIDLRKTRGLY